MDINRPAWVCATGHRRVRIYTIQVGSHLFRFLSLREFTRFPTRIEAKNAFLTCLCMVAGAAKVGNGGGAAKRFAAFLQNFRALRLADSRQGNACFMPSGRLFHGMGPQVFPHGTCADWIVLPTFARFFEQTKTN